MEQPNWALTLCSAFSRRVRNALQGTLRRRDRSAPLETPAICGSAGSAFQSSERPTSNAAWLSALLVATVLVRTGIQSAQPIVENYVGRQIPTAMVARNLERGSGFLAPQLDTGPFPNLFLVEPPVYAATVAALGRVLDLPLELRGRLVSALAIAAGAWGLFGLVRRREGSRPAWLAATAFVAFPITIRYGRAFQPDAMMIGLLVAGLRLWDDFETARAASTRVPNKSPGTVPPRRPPTEPRKPRADAIAFLAATVAGALESTMARTRHVRPMAVETIKGGRFDQSGFDRPSDHDTDVPRTSLATANRRAPRLYEGLVSTPALLTRPHILPTVSRQTVSSAIQLAGAVGLLSLALALKVFSVYILIPLFFVVTRSTRWRQLGLATLVLIPALGWYGHAAAIVAGGSGSQASADNQRIWLSVLGSDALLRVQTFQLSAQFLLRSFTPVGLILAAVGMMVPGPARRLANVWGLAAVAMLALLAAKLHHEYYWLAVAPAVAIAVGRGFERLLTRRGLLAPTTAAAFLTLCVLQSLSTYRTPPEWSSLVAAAAEVQRHVPSTALLVAPEALLFQADRRGCRLEYTETAASRAAGEWGGPKPTLDAIELVEFYRRKGARFVADVTPSDPARLALHEAIRRRYNVVIDRPGILLAALNPPQDAPDGTR